MRRAGSGGRWPGGPPGFCLRNRPAPGGWLQVGAARSVGALLLLAACAASPPAPVPAQRRPPAEDAYPVYLSEREVDEPARPLVPIEPRYPPLERSLGTEGEATLRVYVRADGAVAGASLAEGAPTPFAEAAAEAVRATPFAPARLHGRAVASSVTVHVRFRIGP